MENLKNTINELKEQMKEIMINKGHVHHKTLQKINNQLNNTMINNGNINNINNIYVKYNNVSHDNLTKNEIMNILTKRYCSLEESIKTLHFNDKYPEQNNIFITNLQNKIGYAFNGEKFVAMNKQELINEIIDNHLYELSMSLKKI